MVTLPDEWTDLTDSLLFYNDEDELKFEVVKGRKDKTSQVKLEVYEVSKQMEIDAILRWQIKSIRAGDPGVVFTSEGQHKTSSNQPTGFFEFYFLDSIGQTNYFRKIVFTKRNKIGVLEISDKRDKASYTATADLIEQSLKY